jgi:hypothetical protein
VDVLVGAFQTAWVSLLNAQRVNQHNIGQLPTLLMTAILNAASNGENDEEKLAAMGLSQLVRLESERDTALYRTAEAMRAELPARPDLHADQRSGAQRRPVARAAARAHGDPTRWPAGLRDTAANRRRVRRRCSAH